MGMPQCVHFLNLAILRVQECLLVYCEILDGMVYTIYYCGLSVNIPQSTEMSLKTIDLVICSSTV